MYDARSRGNYTACKWERKRGVATDSQRGEDWGGELGILYHDSGAERERREEREKGGRRGRDRREKRRRVNSLFLEAPLKRPPKLSPFSSPVPALTSLCLCLSSSHAVPSLSSLLLGMALYCLASLALFSLSLSLDLSHTRYWFLSSSAFFLPSSFLEGRYTVEKKSQVEQ